MDYYCPLVSKKLDHILKLKFTTENDMATKKNKDETLGDTTMGDSIIKEGKKKGLRCLGCNQKFQLNEVYYSCNKCNEKLNHNYHKRCIPD